MSTEQLCAKDYVFCEKHRIWYEKKLLEKAKKKKRDALDKECFSLATSIKACPMCEAEERSCLKDSLVLSKNQQGFNRFFPGTRIRRPSHKKRLEEGSEKSSKGGSAEIHTGSMSIHKK